MNENIPDSSVRRLSAYLRQLEIFFAAGVERVSSQQLAEHVKTGAAQVRRDLTLFGQFGKPGQGYKVADLIERLREIMGTRHPWKVIVVGTGGVGGAFLRYEGFAGRGFEMVAAVDKDPKVIGRKIGGVVIRDIDELDKVINETGVRLAVLSVPAGAAQETADRLAAAGIEGILDFAKAGIEAPPNVQLHYVDITANLEQLSFKVVSHS